MRPDDTGPPGPDDRPARRQRPRGATGRPTGRPPEDRPLPSPMLCATSFRVPDRLLRERLSRTAKDVGVALCRLARDGEQAVDSPNQLLRDYTGLSERRVQLGLAELERAGWVYRLLADDWTGLANLEIVNYRDPWADGERPGRAIVLLWRLPQIPLFLREGVTSGAGGCRSRRPGPKGGGA
jgi:hypothetical protein